MLIITTKETQVRFEKDGASSVDFHKNELSYRLSEDVFELFTIPRREKLVTESIKNGITVNGMALTSENADELLAIMRRTASAAPFSASVQTDWLEENAASAAYLRHRPLTVLAEGDPLPETRIPGHTAVYRDSDGKNKHVYEFDGFVWIHTTSACNFVADLTSEQNTSFIDNLSLLYKRKEGNTCYLSIVPGQKINETVRLSDVRRLTTDYEFNELRLEWNENKRTVRLDPFMASSFLVDNYDDTVDPAEELIIDGCFTDYISLGSYAAKNLEVSNIYPFSEDREAPEIFLSGQSIYVHDLETEMLNISLPFVYENGTDVPAHYKVRTENVRTVNGTATVWRYGYTYGSTTEIDMEVSGVRDFSLVSMLELQKVKLDLRDSVDMLERVYLGNTWFATPQLQDDFVNDLCKYKYTKSPVFEDRYVGDYFVLTDEQKQKLCNAGFVFETEM